MQKKKKPKQSTKKPAGFSEWELKNGQREYSYVPSL